MKIQYLKEKPESYDFDNVIYVWDNFLSNSYSDFIDNEVYMNSNWRYCNQVISPECCHTLWGRTYLEDRPDYIDDLISILEFNTGVSIYQPEYIGLNGQTKGMDACLHRDCAKEDAPNSISFLYYVGSGDSNGDLIIYNDDREPIERIEFQKNRVVLFDGYIPHSANGPDNTTLRMSFVYRGFSERGKKSRTELWNENNNRDASSW